MRAAGIGYRGLPSRFVPRTRGARDNRGPSPGFSRVIPRLLSSLVLWDTAAYGKVTKNLGLPCWASASNVPSVSHCCCTCASSFRRASRLVLDFGGAGGVAMVTAGSPSDWSCWCWLAQRWRAVSSCHSTAALVHERYARAMQLYSLICKPSPQPLGFASVSRPLACKMRFRAAIDGYGAVRDAPREESTRARPALFAKF